MHSAKVTCICITYNRLELLKESIRFFEYQTYQNRDLIVLFQSNDAVTRNYVQMQNHYRLGSLAWDISSGESTYKLQMERDVDSTILFVQVPIEQSLSLGAKRNIGVELASGEYVCMWDDDDWYPEDRIENQFNFMLFSGKKACTLASLLLHNKATGQFFLTGIRAEGWEGTLLAEKAVMGRYNDLNKREDTPVIHHLQENNHLCVMEEAELYVYNAHQNNVSGDGHFNFIIHYAKPADLNDYPRYKKYLDTLASAR